MRCLSFLLTGCAVAAFLTLLGGCSSHEAASAGSPAPPANMTARVQQIQNDPHIPPQARQNIIGAMQQGRAATR